MKTRKPETFVPMLYDQGDGRPSLQSQMKLTESKSKFTEITKQSDSAREKYLSGVTGIAALESYEDAWPAEAYARIYLNGTVRNIRWQERHGRKSREKPMLKGAGLRNGEGRANESTGTSKRRRAMFKRSTSKATGQNSLGTAVEEEQEDVDRRGDEAESRDAANTSESTIVVSNAVNHESTGD
ncbi:hypothetical protein EIP86_005092 [Pleurotus ostreatoroseus]|nr:hypothetical protein EIP86_005092 [Pleurotus ostreatoroseus]